MTADLSEVTHTGNADLLTDVVLFVYIDAVKLCDGTVVVGETFVQGLDRFAWSAPLCPKVDEHDLVAVYLARGWVERYVVSLAGYVQCQRSAERM